MLHCISDQAEPQMSPTCSMVSNVSQRGSYKKNANPRTGNHRNNIAFQKLTDLLREYSQISLKLRNEDYTDHQPGTTLSVLITHVENEKFFWAQILEDVRKTCLI